MTSGIHPLPRIWAAAPQPAAEGGEDPLDNALDQTAVAVATVPPLLILQTHPAAGTSTVSPTEQHWLRFIKNVFLSHPWAWRSEATWRTWFPEVPRALL